MSKCLNLKKKMTEYIPADLESIRKSKITTEKDLEAEVKYIQDVLKDGSNS